MRLTADLQVGADTHTGRVRSTNEDDYLLLCSEALAGSRGHLFVVADGMGGVTGGAEASRAAVRALATAFLTGEGDGEPSERMRRGFVRACERVFRLSRENPRLRDMGTTMTAVNLVADRMVLGHVGDTRCFLLRGGKLEQLTEDHAVRQEEHHLTRCIGGGRETEQVDVIERSLRAGDVVLLASDGLWDMVPADTMQRILAGAPPQEAASRLVAEAVLGGGPDNCTALVVRIARLAERPAPTAEAVLPSTEVPQLPPITGRVPPLKGSQWPWVLLAAAAGLGALAAAKLLLDLDLFTVLAAAAG